jgi:DNA-binding CsgD family transcriptional regulator
MRALTFLVTIPNGLHPFYQLFEEESGLVRDRASQVNLLDDGTLVLLGRVLGEVEEIERRLSGLTDVVDYTVSNEDEEGATVYVHVQPPPTLTSFLSLPHEHEVLIDFPVEGTPDGRLRIVMVGKTNKDLYNALADVPDEFDVVIERIGDYTDDSKGLRGMLTQRQREILDVAAELGYYEVPRRATQQDIADYMGLSTGTVSEHFQKIESQLLGTIALPLDSEYARSVRPHESQSTDR